MGVLDKLKNTFGIDEEDEDELDYEDEEVEETPAENTFKADFSRNVASAQPKRERSISTSSLGARLQVVLVKPERYEEASDIADSLNAKKTVVLNLEATNKETSRSLVDFLIGVAYANQGNVQKIANSTFLITPYTVDISGIGLMDDIETGSSGTGDITY